MSQKGQRKTAMTIAQKIAALQAFEQKRATIKQLQLQYGCGKTQIYDLIKHKDRLRREWSQSGMSAVNTSQRRRPRSTANDAINRAIHLWYLQQSASRLVTGTMLQAHAILVAEAHGRTEFKASNGWLASFLRRHNVLQRPAAKGDDDNEDAQSGWDVMEHHQAGDLLGAEAEAEERCDGEEKYDPENKAYVPVEDSGTWPTAADVGDDDDDKIGCDVMEYKTEDLLGAEERCDGEEKYDRDDKAYAEIEDREGA